MRIIREQTSLVVVAVMAMTGLVFGVLPNLAAAQAAPTPAAPPSAANSFNPPPCDYNNTFYQDNGVDPTQVVGRFGTARRTGVPATGNQVNWVADTSCSQRDPDRRNFRILATTGGFPDDGTGTPTEFISLIGFVTTNLAVDTRRLRPRFRAPSGRSTAVWMAISKIPGKRFPSLPVPTRAGLACRIWSATLRPIPR